MIIPRAVARGATLGVVALSVTLRTTLVDPAVHVRATWLFPLTLNPAGNPVAENV